MNPNKNGRIYDLGAYKKAFYNFAQIEIQRDLEKKLKKQQLLNFHTFYDREY